MTGIAPSVSLADADLCTGCGACAAVCRHGAIDFKDDREGFRMPVVDASRCVRCGACSLACPALHADHVVPPENVRYKPKFLACRLRAREELSNVSSGGAFWALACAVLKEGGVVYGASQQGVDRIAHARATSLDEASAFRRSKYLPSETVGIYNAVLEDLERGLPVLFSGTGCQVAGLNSVIGCKRGRLVTCEVVCHGVPSMKAWRKFREEREKAVGRRMESLVFRDKSRGWSDNSYRTTYSGGVVECVQSPVHPFHFGYLNGFFLRRSCGHCPFASQPRVADLTLADFWKYEGPLRIPGSDEGVSLVEVNSPAGESLMSDASAFLEIEPASAEDALASCRHLAASPKVGQSRQTFFDALEKGGYMQALEKAYQMEIGDSAAVPPPVRGRALIRRYYAEMGLRAYVKSSVFGCFSLLWRRRRIQVVVTDSKAVGWLGGLLGKTVVDKGLANMLATQYFALKDAFLLLSKKNVPVFYYNRVGKEKSDGWSYAPSAVERMRRGLSFPVMYSDIPTNERDLRELFGDRYSREYVEEIGKIPQIVEKGGVFLHEDCKGRCVNVVGGRRVTCFQPKAAKRTLHLYGRCGAFGYAVEDADTLASRMQKELVDLGHGDVKVVNHGLWGGSDYHLDNNFLHDVNGFGEDDIVVFYRMHFDKRLQKRLEEVGVRYREITHEWHAHPESKWCFYDRPGHMNADGYRIAAQIMAEDLSRNGLAPLPVAVTNVLGLCTPYLTEYLKTRRDSGFASSVAEYVDGILAQYPLRDGMRCGAIVMNCNPFTLGHKWLIEHAAGKVDRLYVFVVEEDKSLFKFKDRLEMVRAGSAGIKNVVVVPSGRFIISSLTFPEYFMKDYVKEKGFDVSGDVRTFCGLIAPRLGISVRFVGEEPLDPVTNRYNECMKQILPEYGMTLCEVPRLSIEGRGVINATEVRRLIENGDDQALSMFLPESTIKILNAGYMGEKVKTS